MVIDLETVAVRCRMDKNSNTKSLSIASGPLKFTSASVSIYKHLQNLQARQLSMHT